MNKVIFLDRDGTINTDCEVYCIDDFQFNEGAIMGLRLLQGLGYKLAVVTNQRKIAEQRCSEHKVQAINAYWLDNYLPKQNVQIAAWAYCPHAIEEHCNCRKPATGMAGIVEKQIGPVDYANSWMIGDKPSDMQFGKNLGMHTILINSQYADADPNADYVVSRLYNAALLIGEVQ